MFGAMTSLTGGGGLQGGSAGPSAASSHTSTVTTNNSGFTSGSINFGSNNGVPTWAIVAAICIGGIYVYKSTK